MKTTILMVAACAAILTGCSGEKKSYRAPGEMDAEETEVKTEQTSPAEIGSKNANESRSEGNNPEIMNQVPDNGKPTVIDFNAVWCGPCRMMAPVFERMASKYGDEVNFVSIDIDENQDLAAKYQVQAVPTFVFLDEDGKESYRIKGAMEETEFDKIVGDNVWR